MRAFHERDGNAVAILDGQERSVFARLVADVGELIGGVDFAADVDTDGREDDARAASSDPLARALAAIDAVPQAPRDPALLRLFPHAAPRDPEVSEEFRRLTEHDLSATKVERLRAMWEALSGDRDEWVVDREDVMPTAAALTDIRLVLASRLGIVTDDDATALYAEVEAAHVALESDDPDMGDAPERIWMGMLYQALTWLQESLLEYAMRNDV